MTRSILFPARLCFLISIAAVANPTAAAERLAFSVDTWTFVKTMMGFGAERALDEHQDVLLIGAGFGRTGTSSFMTAMERLGMKSYHMGMAMRTPGHFDLWDEHSTLLTEAKENGESTEGATDAILASLAQHGFNATASMPICFIYKDLMERYPNAKVILTVRGDGNGHAWAASVQGTIGKLFQNLKRAPVKWLSKPQKLNAFMQRFFELRGVHLNQITRQWDTDDLARMYNEWVQEVQATVPPERLLVFAAQQGWQPLCDFVSPLNEQVAANCQEILASGEPYPRVNERKQMETMLAMIKAVCTLFEKGPFVLVVVGMLWLVVNRAKQSPTGGDGKSKRA